MESIKIIIEHYNTEIILGLLISIFCLLILFLIYIYRTNKSIKRYNQLVNGIKDINIEDLLININNDIENAKKDINLMEHNIGEMRTKLAFAIQKVGFIRYNAFDDMGSELSFSIALLDEFKNGFVITSIYGREDTVTYGKPIKNGTSNLPLSAEEMLAIDRAIKGSINE